MGTLTIGFSAVWCLLSAYLAWMGIQQHRLRCELEQALKPNAQGESASMKRAA